MDLTNDRYTIILRSDNWTERYYRDAEGWVKESTRGRTFRATAEQVLNHLLPALAHVKPGLTVLVEYSKGPQARQPKATTRSRTRPKQPR